MLYTEVSAYDMKRDLKKLDRDYFSMDALEVYRDLIEDLGENVKWDPIGFCCEFHEYSKEDFDSLIQDYGYLADISYETWLLEDEAVDTQDRREDYVHEVLVYVLENHTMIWELNNDGILIQIF